MQIGIGTFSFMKHGWHRKFDNWKLRYPSGRPAIWGLANKPDQTACELHSHLAILQVLVPHTYDHLSLTCHNPSG